MSLIDHPRPAFPPEAARRLLVDHFGLDGEVSSLDSERDQNLLVASPGGAVVFKIVNAAEPPDAVAFQTALLLHVAAHGADLPLPRIVPSTTGAAIAHAVGPTGERHALRVVTYLEGAPLGTCGGGTVEALRDLGRVLGRLDAVLGSFGHPGAFREFDWSIRQTLRSRGRLPAIRDERRRALVAAHLDRFEQVVVPAMPRLRHSVIHNDANDWNVLAAPSSDRITGLIDVGDAVFAPTVTEAAIAAAYAILAGDDAVARARAVVAGYHEALPLTDEEVDLVPDLMAARLAISVSVAASRRAVSDDPYLFVSEAPAWRALEWLAADGASTLRHVLRADCRTARAALPPRLDDAALAEARRRLLPPNLSLSYRTPLHIVSGQDVWLTAADGRRYLDCYNNVAHVGHGHPRIVAALAAQAAVLNTNTRYLHENVVAYAERLRATLPPGLDTFFFVNSGSEANDLALRIARTATGRHGVVVLDWAYHGHTQALIEISPYKYKRRGGRGRSPFVTELPLPDVYRAPDDWRPFEHGARFAAEARRLLAGAGGAAAPAAFIAETVPSVGGQMFLPEGYLAEVYDAVRRMGALCIADEVQVGFGRVGTRMWAFEEHGVVPDIVTMGKPAGAGHPLGVVATTREVAAAFSNGMEYFNTFGGNPVSCAVGLAVLDVLDEGRLLENARVQGQDLLDRFRALADRHPCLGDVRGRGLFLGLDVVSDRRTKAHDGETARAVVNHAVEMGVLLGTDGPQDNVIKVRPPMTFTRAHADLLVGVLDRALSAAGG
ncbi:MAG: aminotransferase class III-fold pyridoxal phosphate-dependent enzyme [Vicinamibacterales bacterium]